MSWRVAHANSAMNDVMNTTTSMSDIDNITVTTHPTLSSSPAAQPQASSRKKRAPSDSEYHSSLLTSPRKIAALSLDESRSTVNVASLAESPLRMASSSSPLIGDDEFVVDDDVDQIDSDDVVTAKRASMMAMSRHNVHNNYSQISSSLSSYNHHQPPQMHKLHHLQSSSGGKQSGSNNNIHSGSGEQIASLATPMSLPDGDLSDDYEDEFTFSTSPMLPPSCVSMPTTDLGSNAHISSGVDLVVDNGYVNPNTGTATFNAFAATNKVCPPTPSPARVRSRVPRSSGSQPNGSQPSDSSGGGDFFRRPRSNVLVGAVDSTIHSHEDDAPTSSFDETALADRIAQEQLMAASGSSIRLFADNNKRPPPSPRYRAPPRSPLPMRRRAASQSQPVLVNPFSPTRRHTLDAASVSHATQSTSRYASDFTEQGVLGRGVSSIVYKATNNTDGWVYAIKVKHGGTHGVPKQSLNEMFALAALGSHVNVIRYYNAWIEDPRLFLQCEFCSGGSVEQRLSIGGVFTEAELCILFRQMASALVHIHAHQLVHLDVKPENMFIATGGPPPTVDAGPSLYKLGDLGLISTASDKESFEDGDSRYLPTELLNADSTASAIDLPRADVFSLGASIYELARRHPLPPRETEWHEIRRLDIARPPHISQSFFDLLLSTMHPVVAQRPSASDLLQHRLLLTPSQREIEDLTARVRQLENQLKAQTEKQALCM